MRNPTLHRARLWVALTCICVSACEATAPEGQAKGPPQPANRAAPAEPKAAAAAAPEPARYVGSQACQACHTEQAQRWRGSQHDLAMQVPSAESVLGDFDDARFQAQGETFHFRRAGKQYWVDVTRAGSKQTFPVRYVFGVEPLQQVLLDVGKGHLQALSVAWDSRPKAQGGQRWFFLNPGETIPHGDPLHWQGPQFTYNRMCADCHSTGVEKGYVRAAQSYETRHAEIDVACEACHGPSSQHVTQARAGKPHAGGTHGLGGAGRRWVFSEGASIAHLQGERREEEQQACAPCHSRRADLGPAPADESFHDRYRLSLLDDLLYFADGQVRDEVYVYGSFLQSPMHAAGVTCSDCHDPHSLKLRAEGNALCARCHAPKAFDTPEHTLHAAGSAGTACVACHMPERTYMVVDPRREHRFGVPRPDLSARLGSPDPCTACHQDQSSEWAAQVLKKRGRLRSEPHFGEALQDARTGQPGAAAGLAAWLTKPAVAPIVRATALSELAQLSPADLPSLVRKAAQDESPLVRRAAAEALVRLPPSLRESAGGDLLADPIRSVRAEAAEAFVELDPSSLRSATRGAREAALRDHLNSARYRADAADGLVGLARLHTTQGDAEGALAQLREAIEREPAFAPAYVNLADVLRALGRDAQARDVLQQGLRAAAEAAPLYHALGLLEVREQQLAQALQHLSAAHEDRPDIVRYAFVYAVALFDTGQRPKAIEVLKQALDRSPDDLQLLGALAGYCAQLGMDAQARAYAARLEGLRRAP